MAKDVPSGSWNTWILEYSTEREMKGRRRDCKAETGAPLGVVQYSDDVTE